MQNPEITESARSAMSDFDDGLAWFGFNVILTIALVAILWSPAIIFYVAATLVPTMLLAIIGITLNPKA
jgi:hypothetical protein